MYQKEATKKIVFAVEQEPSCKESRVKRVKSERTTRHPDRGQIKESNMQRRCDGCASEAVKRKPSDRAIDNRYRRHHALPGMHARLP